MQTLRWETDEPVVDEDDEEAPAKDRRSYVPKEGS